MPRPPYAGEAALEALLSGPLAGFTRLNTFRMFAHAPDLGRAWLGVTHAILNRLALSATLREIAILQVARETDCLYIWTQHARLARRAGVEDGLITIIDRGGEISVRDGSDEALVRRAAREAATEGRIAAATFDQVIQRLGNRAAVELVMVIGHYLAGAVFLKTTEVGMEPAHPHRGAPG